MQISARNSLLLKRSLGAVWHPCTQMKHHETLPLVPVARGAGCWLYDLDGDLKPTRAEYLGDPAAIAAAAEAVANQAKAQKK